MFSCMRKHFEKNNSCNTPNKDKTAFDKKRFLRDSCLLCGIIIVIISCIVLFAFMDDEDWTENIYQRQRILLIAVILFMTSTGLCLYVWRSDKKQEGEYLQLLIIEKPPSYDSVVFQEPPPAYITVVQSIHIIQQETTGALNDPSEYDGMVLGSISKYEGTTTAMQKFFLAPRVCYDYLCWSKEYVYRE